MTMVAIVNQKDGVGKTTLAWSLARTGIMLLVNAGPQGSARDWNHFNITAPMACLCKAIQPDRAVPTRFHAYPTRQPRPD